MQERFYEVMITLVPQPVFSEYWFLAAMHGALFEGASMVSWGYITSEMFQETNIAVSYHPSGFRLRLNKELFLHVESIIEGLRQVFSVGIGPDKKFKARIVDVSIRKAVNTLESLQEFPNSNLSVLFKTPTVIVSNGQIQRLPSWYALVARSADRLIKLGYDIRKEFWLELAKPDDEDILPIFSNTALFQRERMSGRAKRKHNIMGMVGELVYPKQAWKASPLVAEALQWGIGKTPALGMGRGTITLASSVWENATVSNEPEAQ